MAQWEGAAAAPVISVLCHAYNHGRFIADALDGVLCQQTRFPFELIVHDDASDDDTAAVIADYHRRYPEIVRPVYQCENQYRRGIKPGSFTKPMARGRLIALCEGDDYWIDPRKLERQAEFLDTHTEYAICGHDAFVVEDGRIVAPSKLPPGERRDASAARMQRCETRILTLSVMYRDTESPPPPESAHLVNGDTFLFSRLAAQGGYKFLDDLLPGGYRRHSGGVWSLIDEERRHAAHATTYYWMSRYYQRVGEPAVAAYFVRQAAAEPVRGSDDFGLRDYLQLCFELSGILRRRWRTRLARWVKAGLKRLKFTSRLR